MQEEEDILLENMGVAFSPVADKEKEDLASKLKNTYVYVSIVVPVLPAEGQVISTNGIIYELVKAVTAKDKQGSQALVIILPSVKPSTDEFEKALEDYRQTMKSRVSA